MRGLWSTLVLILVLAGLVGYIYFVDAKRDPAASDREKVFASVSAADIDEVQITSADGETTRVSKTDGAWRVVEPITAAADESELSSIASGLADLEIQRVVDENAGNLAQYALDPGRIEVSFRVKGGSPQRLLLGERTPTGGDLYARFPDQTRVFLVSSFVDSTFNKNTFALRDKSIIEIDRDAVDGVEIVAGARTIRLAKSGTEWRITQPVTARADFAAVEGSLERLSSGQMQAIVAPEGGDLKRYTLEPPIASFTALSGSSRATLLFGETENAVIYAKDASRPIVFTVAPTMYTDVIRDLSEYRRKDLFDARSFTATRVELRRGADTIVLEKSKSADKEIWRNAAGQDVDAAKVETLLSQLTGLRADSFETAASPALKTPALVVTVRFDDNKSEQVTFARSGSDVVAARSDEPGTATLTAGPFDEALKALEGVQ